MLKENELIGAIVIYRTEVRPLATSRSSWLRVSPPKPSSPSRMRDCSTSCANARPIFRRRLTSKPRTSEVLQVSQLCAGRSGTRISIHLANTVRICEAKFGTLYRTEGDSVRCVAMHDVPKAFAKERRRVPVIRPAPSTTLARALATKRPVQIADVRDYPDPPSGYTGGSLATLAGARTLLTVPMLTDVESSSALYLFTAKRSAPSSLPEPRSSSKATAGKLPRCSVTCVGSPVSLRVLIQKT